MILGISEWVILLVTVIGCGWYYFWKKTQYYKELNILSVDGYPIFGNTLGLFFQMEHIKDFIDTLYYKFTDERYVGLFSFTTPLLLIKDLDLIKQITVKDFDHFSDHIEFVDPEIDPLSGKMLFLLKGDQWREMRHTLSPAFTSSKMRGMLPLMQECGKELVVYLDKMFASRKDKDNDIMEVEIKDTFTRCTNDIIASCGFGIKTNSLVETENTFYKMSKAFTTLDFWENVKLLLFAMVPFIPKVLGLEFGSNKVNTFFKNLVTSNMKEREEKHIVREDMINLLMLAKQGKLVDETTQGKEEAKRKTKLEWTNDEITAQVMIFLFAGLESTATMISFMAYELAKNKQVQQKLQKEIDDLLKKSDGKIEYDGINHLKYLDMVCSETLRLWPVAPNTDRTCTKPYVLPSQSDKNVTALKLNKGDQIWIPTMSIHRDPKFFPNPEEFDPERFSDDRKDSIVPFSYFPFGVGPRQCIGTRFALMEAKILIVNLLSKYNLIKISKTLDPMVLKNSVFEMNPANGFWVGLKPRKTADIMSH